MSTDVSRFLDSKFLEWQVAEGGRKTLTAFAGYLGVSKANLSNWINGRRRPDDESLVILSRKLGPEIYDAMGLSRPDPRLQAIISHWGEIPDDVQKELAEAALRAIERKPAKGSRARVGCVKRK